MQKFCPSCRNTLDGSLFNKSKRRDGLRSYCRSCDSKYQKAKSTALKDKVFAKLGKVCLKCGFNDRRALQIDHVNGGGNREHREITNPSTFLRKVLDDDTGAYQILCANCNWIKRHERRENPKNVRHTPEGTEGIRRANTGRKPTPEQRRRMSESHQGQVISLEHRHKFREATAENWKNPVIRKARIDGFAERRRLKADTKKLFGILLGFTLMEQGVYVPT